jgi:hypothetical protein
MRRAFAVSATTLKLFGQFAAAKEDGERFDRAAALGGGGVVGRANLAFALGEVALLDAGRAEWREMVPA